MIIIILVQPCFDHFLFRMHWMNLKQLMLKTIQLLWIIRYLDSHGYHLMEEITLLRLHAIVMHYLEHLSLQ
jgi:hypothetical protein